MCILYSNKGVTHARTYAYIYGKCGEWEIRRFLDDLDVFQHISGKVIIIGREMAPESLKTNRLSWGMPFVCG